MREKPVYLFTGFLGCGKTTFIQDTLSTPEFGENEKTLLLVCEEGEVEYDASRFADDVHIVVIEEEEELTEAKLNGIASRVAFDRVLVEYNGMWKKETLFSNMPRNWLIAQEMAFFEAESFFLYNKNMRQLCFDKMQGSELVVFNRFPKGEDKLPYHKEVRIANRRAQILYEYDPHEIEVDDIPDPLPFDKAGSQIAIADEWYAEWYRDINENQDDYNNKTITVKGRVALSEELPAGKFAFGRHLMTCCIEDVQFAGLMCVYAGKEALHRGDWVKIKAKVRVEYEKAYREKGPVLYCKAVEPCDPAEPEIATF